MMAQAPYDPKTGTRRRGRPPELDRAAIAEAALAEIDGFSVARVARRLGALDATNEVLACRSIQELSRQRLRGRRRMAVAFEVSAAAEAMTCPTATGCTLADRPPDRPQTHRAGVPGGYHPRCLGEGSSRVNERGSVEAVPTRECPPQGGLR